MQPVLLATDGSCLRRLGPGGWAAVLQHGRTEAVYVGSAAHTTSHRMELTALLGGLTALRALAWPCALVTVITDSQSVAHGVNGTLRRWGEPNAPRCRKDTDLWRAIAAVLPPCPLQATWVPSRSLAINQQVDALARSAALFADRAVLHPTVCWT
jgi:ribonuclease HI